MPQLVHVILYVHIKLVIIIGENWYFGIFLAIFTLSSAVSGMPLLSKVSPATAAPYFFTKGSILSNTSSSPLTEFKIGFPL